jgi:hypothetical protein
MTATPGTNGTAHGTEAPPRPARNGTSPISEIFELAIGEVKPAVVNDVVYGVIDPDDPSLDDLAESMAARGQLEPVVLTLDNILLSGHRRRAVALRLGWPTLKARRHPIRSGDPEFEQLLVTCNTQRDKSPDVRIREQIVLADPESAYEALVAERARASQVKAETLTLGSRKPRSLITAAKRPFLDAIEAVLEDLKQYWPLSDRRIHYALLNDPPLIHGSKPGSTYRNDGASYKACCELLTRARLVGLIPFEAIGDETRPVTTWDVHPNASPFIRDEVDEFCKGYWRDLMQGQPNHLEIVGEKLTVEGIVRPIAARYCIPYTIGRGYSSLPPRKAMFDRFTESGKKKLVILSLGDHDPEGWDIAESFAKSMRDDFDVEEVAAVKVALKPEQIEQLGLPPNTNVKTTSSRFKKFVRRFGTAVYELEAVEPSLLQRWLDEAVRSVLNISLFNAQVELEKQDAAAIADFRQEALAYLKQHRPEGGGA